MNAYGLVRLTKDPEQTGVTVKFTVAQNRIVKGEQFVDFWNCVAFKGTGDAILNNVHKGQRINITSGEFHNNNYTKDGVQYYGTQLIVNRFDFIEPKQPNAEIPRPNDNNQVRPPIDVSESDLPF